MANTFAGGFTDRLLTESRAAIVAGLAGATAGVIVGGIGGRLAMRASTLIASGPVVGRRTEGGNTIGSFTFEGTISLIIFAGLGTGVIVGVMWYALRPWLRRLGRGEIVGTAVAAIAFGTSQVINPENIDFTVLQPAGRQVALFLILIAILGALTPLLDRFMDRRLPTRRGALFVYLPMAALGAIFVVPAFGSLISETFCFCRHPPVVAGWLLMGTFVVTALMAVRRLTGQSGESLWLHRTGLLLATSAIAAGLVSAIRVALLTV